MQYTNAALDALRVEGDPLADAVVEALMQNQQVEEADQILRGFQTNYQAIPAELPIAMQEYLRATQNPPAWADLERIKSVHSFFLDDGVNISAVLSLGAMVGCYAVPHGAKLLTMTHRLKHPKRRITETGQFCFYMMDERAFEEGGQFIPSVQKVRLIHAAVRHLLSRNADWPQAEYGVPICQEDLLGALMLFSSQVLDGLERLGAVVTPKEAEDYYYVWRVTGSMLGIREDIIPPTLEEARELNLLLKQRHLGPSPEGIELTRDLLDMYEEMIPGKVADGIIPAMVRYVVGDEIADWMEVPSTKWYGATRLITRINRILGQTEQNNDLAKMVLDRAGQALLMGQMRLFTSGQRVQYEIPADLTENWQSKPAFEAEIIVD